MPLKSSSAELEIATFLAKYSPEIAAHLQAARSRLRKMFPRGCELVYDNYNALVFAFAPGERASQAALSVAGYPRWVTLFFLEGVKLKDPHKLLQGSGSQVRGVRLASASDLDQPAIRALVEQAIAPHHAAFAAAAPLRTVIKSVSAKQRARRPSPREAEALAAMARILVTGSAGHLGEALVRTLRDAGEEVASLDIAASPFTDVVASVTDREAVRRCMKGVDAVLHAASLHKPHLATHSRQASSTSMSPARSSFSRKRWRRVFRPSSTRARPALSATRCSPRPASPLRGSRRTMPPFPRTCMA
jgi:hypothetical protein